MRPPALPAPLRGIIPPLVTPLLDQDQIDVPGTQRLIEHVVSGGVHGVFVLGTTGEEIQGEIQDTDYSREESAFWARW